MRVRYKQHPKYPDNYIVETKHWPFPWSVFEMFGSEERARECAKRLANPYMVEIKKDEDT